MKTISVVIPTLNEATYLPELLQALRSQTRQPDEIIVADAGSSDGTDALARARGLTVVQGGRPAQGRNAGAQQASGDLFLFLDADVLPEPDFIERALDEFTRVGCIAATCFLGDPGGKPRDQLVVAATNFMMWAVRPFSPHAPGFCILVEGRVHRQIGGFDESLLLSEDHDFVRRASQFGGFRILRSVRIPVSLRRIDKEGLGSLTLKYAWCELQLLLHRPLHSLPFVYEFGTHRPRRAGRALSSAFRRWTRRLRWALN